jgi:hypothetical protein
LAIGLVVVSLAGCGGASSKGGKSAKPIQSAELAVAPVYSSVNHVLHLRVRASTATSTIAGVIYKKMDIYDTSVVDGQGRFRGRLGGETNRPAGGAAVAAPPRVAAGLSARS